MATKESTPKAGTSLQQIIDIIIKIGVLSLLIGWCFQIIRPFVIIFIWGVIIAIALYPLYDSIRQRLRFKPRLAATLITFLLLAILFIPTYFLASSMFEGVKQFGTGLSTESFHIPLPPAEVAGWPVIGKTLHATWQALSENWMNVATKYKDQLLTAGEWLFNALVGAGMGFIQFLLSVLISGILLATSDKGAVLSKQLFRKLAGSRGDDFVRVAEVTIRNVSKGVIGVAVIQSLFLGIIFILAGVPYAGLWALFCLIFAVIQVGPILVTIPVVIYLYISKDPLPASLWTLLILIGSLLDNVIKPIFMGKGATVPMLVVFLGAIGGFIASGFLGLFIGAIVLSLGYKLLMAWLQE
jgi:predicted PurR-regulated permease PerM